MGQVRRIGCREATVADFGQMLQERVAAQHQLNDMIRFGGNPTFVGLIVGSV